MTISGTVKRYAITHVNKDGMRTLAFANQGHKHFDTREKAQAMLDAMKRNNSSELLRQIYGDGAPENMEVREVECYAHGDAIGIYFED